MYISLLRIVIFTNKKNVFQIQLNVLIVKSIRKFGYSNCGRLHVKYETENFLLILTTCSAKHQKKEGSDSSQNSITICTDAYSR